MTNSMHRNESAEAEYQSYDFGEVGVEDAGGWEYGSHGDEWTRPVFVRTEEGAESSEKITFTVRFKPGSADVDEAYAIDSHGSIWGNRTIAAAPAPMRLTVDLSLLRRPKAFPDQAAAIAWISSCLNCNTNHVEATVTLKS